MAARLAGMIVPVYSAAVMVYIRRGCFLILQRAGGGDYRPAHEWHSPAGRLSAGADGRIVSETGQVNSDSDSDMTPSQLQRVTGVRRYRRESLSSDTSHRESLSTGTAQRESLSTGTAQRESLSTGTAHRDSLSTVQ